MEIKNKIAAVSVGAVTSLAAVTGLAAFAGAQSPPATPDATTQTGVAPADALAPDTTTDGANEANEGPENEADEAAENAALASQASLSAADAEAAAIVAVPGTAGTAQLESENGTVVYEVDVTDDAGMMHEVIIDANSGEVLAQEADDETDEGPDDEANEGPEGAENTNEPADTPAGEAAGN